MMPSKRRVPARPSVFLAGLVAAGLLAAGCAPPGGGEGDGGGRSTEQDFSRIDEPVTPEQVEELGDVTLEVWADAGEEAMLEQVVPAFEKKYPNVEVDLTIKGWDDLMGTVINAMDSPSAPDVAQSNQGYAVMGTLVKAGLLRPLDDVRDAYGLADGVPKSGWEPTTWSKDGASFGKGDLYGIGYATQPLGVFYNKEKLDQLGLEPPRNMDELETALAKAEQQDELPIMLGNSDQYPLGAHVLGILVDAYEDPAAINSWIAGSEGSSFDTPGVRQATETLQAWDDEGFLGSGYNGRSMDDAVADFARGDGVFFLGGSFNGSKIAGIDPEGFGFTTLRNEDGKQATTGSFGTPWSISSKTDAEPAAVAFLGFLASEDAAQAYADDSRLPIFHLDDVQPTGSMHEQQLQVARDLFEGGEFIGYLDWSTTTMQRTLGSGAQELLDGKQTVPQFLREVQSDWDSYQTKRR